MMMILLLLIMANTAPGAVPRALFISTVSFLRQELLLTSLTQ